MSTADLALGTLYREALASLSTHSIGIMRADQVQWLAWVQQVCPLGEGAAAAQTTAMCMLPLYRTRSKTLRAAISRRDGVTFFMRAQFFAVLDSRTAFTNYGEFHGTGTLQATWPAADSPLPEWKAWNRAMEEQALRMAAATADDDAQLLTQGSPAWSDRLATERNTTLTGVLRSVEHGRVTVSLSSETMGIPAAHPSELYQTDTWLLTTGRLLQAHDVFAPGTAWNAQVASACFTALRNGRSRTYLLPEITGPEAKSLQAVVIDTQNWTLEPDGLHITYPEYTVAPRFAQPEDTVIPWTKLKPLLSSTFVQP